MSILQKLSLRKILHQHTSSELLSSQIQHVIQNSMKGSQIPSIYCGFDPTADSLHLGNLFPILTLVRLASYGFRPVFLIGGATGSIGDPSGKSTERDLLSNETLIKNEKGVELTLKRILENLKSHTSNKLIEFNVHYVVMNRIRKILVELNSQKGKYFRLSTLLSRDMIDRRLASTEGISYTEFSYQLLQAYDFKCLHEEENVIGQIGGSDQFGNLLGGCQLIHNKEVFGLTIPLLTTDSGEKFGKSAGNALWLDSEKTSSNEIFQYIFNLPDNVMEDFLLRFTFLKEEEIRELIRIHSERPESRICQRKLAEELISIIFGSENSNTDSKIIFNIDFSELKNENRSSQELNQIFGNLECLMKITKEEVQSHKSIFSLVSNQNLTKTKSELRRIIDNNGLYINDTKISKEESYEEISNFQNYLIGNEYIVLRTGKKNYRVIQIE